MAKRNWTDHELAHRIFMITLVGVVLYTGAVILFIL